MRHVQGRSQSLQASQVITVDMAQEASERRLGIIALSEEVN